MSARLFAEFKKNLPPVLQKNNDKSREFRELLGRMITQYIPDDRAHDQLVEQAITLTGAKPGRKQIDLAGYGHALIINNVKHGTGSYEVSLALYYLLLRLEDTADYAYSQCVAALDAFVFGEGKSYVTEYPDFPLPPISIDQYQALALSWTLFLEKHTQYQDIEIELEIPQRRGLSITDIKSKAPVFDRVIEVGQGFRFLLRFPVSGVGLALQGSGVKTYPMRFSEDRLLFQTTAINLIFPLQADRQAEVYLSESEAQETRFLFIAANHSSGQVLIDIAKTLKVGTEIAPAVLDRLAHDLTTTSGRVEVRQIVVRFRSIEK